MKFSQSQGWPLLGFWRAGLLALACLLSAANLCPAESSGKTERGLTYRRDVVSDVPWSIHILRIDRSRADLELHTTLGSSNSIGLTVLSQQIKTLPPDLGRVLGGVNGDFYRNDNTPYKGDPKGLQITQGELVSGPCDWSCFWIDPSGQPHMTNVIPRFEVTWPDGTRTPFGLNEERKRDQPVLYTSRIGPSTGTRGGRELVLERAASSLWLPLRAGEIYTCRVREVREDGNAAMNQDFLVLSIPKEMMDQLPATPAGSLLRISTATFPSLQSVNTAIGGGPALVRAGQPMKWGLIQVRHPRSAVGWNEKYIYLVEVDGRQAGLSVGMTYSELADYMLNKLGCTEALNLDGGGSATMWAFGQTANSPSKGHERGCANGLVVVQKNGSAP